MRPAWVFKKWNRAALAFASGVWIVAVGAGMKLILDFQVRPGLPANPPSVWPTSTRIPTAKRNPTVLVLVHPHCPCTRATLSELARIMASSEGRLDARVLFAVPPGIDSSWAKTDLWHMASGIPGVRVFVDRDGAEARRFGVATSGQALVYDAEGRLQFKGGITAGRGHAGDNAGADAIVSLVDHQPTERSETPVFGCPLAAPSVEAERSRPSCPSLPR